MTLSILIDTNVVLDYTLVREEHFAPADRIMDEVANGHLNAYVSASQVTDFYYFLEKKFSHEKAVSMIVDLIALVRVIGVNRRTIETAIKLKMLDFEDAVQTIAAKNAGVNIVITRDKEGFYNSGLQVCSPEEFLNEIGYNHFNHLPKGVKTCQ